MGILIALARAMKCARPFVSKALAFLLGFSPCVSLADKADFLVTDDNSTVEQNHPRIAVAGNDGFVITWVDRRSGEADIYVQRFASDGTAIGGNRRVNDDTGDAYQAEPAIATDLTGYYSLVWQDYRNGVYPFDPDVFLQRLDTSVAAIGVNQILTVEQPDSLKETPDIALSPWYGGVVVWADYRNRNWDIYGQLIDTYGTRVGANFRVNDDTGTGQQHAPRVAVSSAGWFVITWYDNRQGNDDIFAQRYSATGTRIGGNVKVNSDNTTARQAFPDVAADGASHFTVVWIDWRNGTYPANPDIYARKYDTTMTPLGADALVNQDGTRRAQREPTIASDRRGNVAIIWSDSSGTAQSYDIVGQMIDVDGVIRETNFQANSETDSAQVHADVALDGRFRYITWADKRNGNYDIYASITRYNDPTLVPEPSDLHFEMLAGGPLPPSQNLSVDHYGYNPLSFQVLASGSWFQVVPASGVTPATVEVSIVADTLPYGTYWGTLTLYDLDNDDSTVQVTVRLDVTAPILDLSADTLDFLVFAGTDNLSTQSLMVSNGGAGDLIWTVTESLDWLQVDPANGVNNADLMFQVNGISLPAGTTFDSVLMDAGSAVYSPGWVWVRVQAVNNQPYMVLDPDSLTIVSVDPVSQTVFTVVRNQGSGQLNWAACSNEAWLHLGRTSGSDDDTVTFTVDTSGLAREVHVATVTFVDPAAFRDTVLLPFVLDYLQPGLDTVFVDDLDLAPSETDSLAIRITLTQSARGLHLPLVFDASLVAVESVHFSSDLPAFVSGGFDLDSLAGTVTLDLASIFTDSLLPPSSYQLAWIVLTAGASTGLCEIGEPHDPGRAAVVSTSTGGRQSLLVLPGQVRVEETTGMEPETPTPLPSCYRLDQNYPNPFNPVTTISLQLPKQTDLVLEVFNILGQRVRLLSQGILPAGIHNVLWDGVFDDNKQAPSGIYFYRLKAEGISLVRKMVLVR